MMENKPRTRSDASGAGRAVWRVSPLSAVGLTLALVISGAPAHAQPQPQQLPNMGQQITPLAPQGSQFQGLNPGLAPPAQDWLASQAVSSVVSPDRKTMLVMTSGYNRFGVTTVQPPTGGVSWYGPDSNEYVFIYDISQPTPVQRQVVQMPATYSGIVFDPSGSAFYVGGCAADYIFVVGQNATTRAWPTQPTAALALGHNKLGLGLNIVPNGATAVNNSVGVYPCAAGVAISNDGQTLVAANYYNDSISVFTGGLGHWAMAPGEQPAAGHAGRRISVLGGGEGRRIERNSVRIQHSRPRDRRGESERDAGGNGPHPGEGPTQQDDAERGPVAAVCRRRPVGYR